MLGASPAPADEIGNAAKRLADASCTFAMKVVGNSGLYLQAPGICKPLVTLEEQKATRKWIGSGLRHRLRHLIATRTRQAIPQFLNSFKLSGVSMRP